MASCHLLAERDKRFWQPLGIKAVARATGYIWVCHFTLEVVNDIIRRMVWSENGRLRFQGTVQPELTQLLDKRATQNYYHHCDVKL